MPQVWLQQEYDDLYRAVQAALDEAVYAACWQEGKAMSLAEAVAYALEDLPAPEPSGMQASKLAA